MRIKILAIQFFLFTGLAFCASSGLASLGDAAAQMCSDLETIVPIIAMFLLVAAGVVYAAGQMMGAETRGRATTWATAMLIGAIIGILIIVVAPPLLKLLYPSGTFDCNVVSII